MPSPHFRLEFTESASAQKANIEATDPAKYKKIAKTLGLLETNLRHPGLHTHKYDSLQGPNGEQVFEAYVENKTLQHTASSGATGRVIVVC